MSSKPLTDKQRYWLTHIERCQAAEQSLASYAQSHDLDVQTLYRWKSMLNKHGCFESSISAAMSSRVAIETHGRLEGATIQVRFPNGYVLQSHSTDEATLHSLTTALLSPS